MQLLGMYDSPFVRRVAITAGYLGLELEHNPLSIFKGYDEFRKLNPMVKIPTLICDDGEVLVDSTLIIDHLRSLSTNSQDLMPKGEMEYRHALKILGIALIAMEKVVQWIYETRQRPAEFQYDEWIRRLDEQLSGSIDLLEEAVGNGETWLFGADVLQPDITTAVAWRFVQHVRPNAVVAKDYPGLSAYSARAEALPEFRACPIG